MGIIATDPSGLAATTTYYLKVNDIEFDVTTGASPPTYEELAGLIDARIYEDNDFTFVETVVNNSTSEKGSWKSDSSSFAITDQSSPYIRVFDVIPTEPLVFNLLAFPFPGDYPTGAAYDCSYSHDGTYLAVAHATSPYVTIYKGGDYSKLSDPASLPTATGYSCAFSNDDTYLAVGYGSGAPAPLIYKRSGDTFTKLTDPAYPGFSTVYTVAWSPDDTYLAVGGNVSPYFAVYKRSGDTFTKLSNPTSLPNGTVYSLEFSPDGNYLAVALSNIPRNTRIYKRTGDNFEELETALDVLPSGAARDVSFSQDGNYLGVVNSGTTKTIVYKIDGETYTKVSGTMQSITSAKSISFSPDNDYLVYGSEVRAYEVAYTLRGFKAKIVDASGGEGGSDIRVYNDAVRGYGSVCQLDHGTSGDDLFVSLNYWPEFRKQPVLARGPAGSGLEIVREMDGELSLGGSAVCYLYFETEGTSFYSDTYYQDEYYGDRA